jgi:hypothetical protein
MSKPGDRERLSTVGQIALAVPDLQQSDGLQ